MDWLQDARKKENSMKLSLPSLGLGFPWNYIAGAVAILALVSAIVFGTVQCKKIDRSNHQEVVQTGVVKEREQTHQEVIKHVEEAHEAVTNPTPAERSIVCSKYDRNCPNGK
jgi:Cu/Ag efflux pump CusA